MDISPPFFRDMAVLDRDAFRKSYAVTAARVPASKVGQFRKAEAVKGYEALSWNCPASRMSNKTHKTLVAAWCYSTDQNTAFEVTLTYDFWTAGQIIEATMPGSLGFFGVPRGFAQAGHIGHVNLQEEYAPCKNLIGQVLLDKNKNLRTILNRVGSVTDNDFGLANWEVLAGDDDYNVTLIESDCTFAFDFSKVFWNSRLQTEHKRLVDTFKPGEVVVDAFAGVGPFAVPSSKKGCFMLANDLNPECATALQANAERNKVSEQIRVSNKDGREFLSNSVREVWEQPFPNSAPISSKKKEKQKQNPSAGTEASPTPVPPPRRRVDHFIMHYPETAIQLLDTFRRILKPLKEEAPEAFDEIYGEKMPMVHCYTYTAELGDTTSIRAAAEKHLGGVLGQDWNEVEYHFVRDAGPTKHTYCLSFSLPKAIALG